MDKQSELVCGTDASFHLSYRNSCISTNKDISSRITLSQTPELENFATASRSSSQQNSSTAELVDHTYDGQRVVAGRTWFVTGQSTVMIQLNYFDLVCICCTTCSSYNNCRHRASRGPCGVSNSYARHLAVVGLEMTTKGIRTGTGT